jgi:hypothetical protein
VLRWTTRWFLLDDLGQKSRINPKNNGTGAPNPLFVDVCFSQGPLLQSWQPWWDKGKSMITASISQSVLPISSYVCRSK